MTIQEAFGLLKLPLNATAETVEEALEQAVFDIKHELLRMEIVPRVFLARITKLKRLHEAECALFEEEVDPEFPQKSMAFPLVEEALERFNCSASTSVEEWIRVFEAEWVVAKQNMAVSGNPTELAKAIRGLAACQYHFEAVLMECVLSSIESIYLDSPKQSEQLGSAGLLSLLRRVGMNQMPLAAFRSAGWEKLPREDYIALQKEKARVLKSKTLAK